MSFFIPTGAGAQSLREMACNGGYEINQSAKALALIRVAIANGHINSAERKLICGMLKKALYQNGYGGECGDEFVEGLIQVEKESPMSISELVDCVKKFPIDTREIYADTLRLYVLSPHAQTKVHLERLRAELIKRELIAPSEAGSLEDAILDLR